MGLLIWMGKKYLWFGYFSILKDQTYICRSKIEVIYNYRRHCTSSEAMDVLSIWGCKYCIIRKKEKTSIFSIFELDTMWKLHLIFWSVGGSWQGSDMR